MSDVCLRFQMFDFLCFSISFSPVLLSIIPIISHVFLYPFQSLFVLLILGLFASFSQSLVPSSRFLFLHSYHSLSSLLPALPPTSPLVLLQETLGVGKPWAWQGMSTVPPSVTDVSLGASNHDGGTAEGGTNLGVSHGPSTVSSSTSYLTSSLKSFKIIYFNFYST